MSPWSELPAMIRHFLRNVFRRDRVEEELDQEIDASLQLFKKYLPYHESDHILNIAYSFLAGGRCLEDIEVLRQDEAYMNMLGAERIPDPTTARVSQGNRARLSRMPFSPESRCTDQ